MTNQEAEILKKIHMLQKTEQNAVLSYVRSLLKKDNGNKLLKFAGAFSHEDIRQMEAAIMQGCNNIDKNEW